MLKGFSVLFAFCWVKDVCWSVAAKPSAMPEAVRNESAALVRTLMTYVWPAIKFPVLDRVGDEHLRAED